MHSCITREKRRTILNKHTNTQKYTHMNEIKKTRINENLAVILNY